jgi:hypothetical protein
MNSRRSVLKEARPMKKTVTVIRWFFLTYTWAVDGTPQPGVLGPFATSRDCEAMREVMQRIPSGLVARLPLKGCWESK